MSLDALQVVPADKRMASVRVQAQFPQELGVEQAPDSDINRAVVKRHVSGRGDPPVAPNGYERVSRNRSSKGTDDSQHGSLVRSELRIVSSQHHFEPLGNAPFKNRRG
jgi:hypothetical protein